MAKIQINYKSGTSIVAKVEQFTVKRDKYGVKSYEWTNMAPRPLDFNADEVESVWEL
ncbi:hypothetical protein AVANI_95 [Mycobacterium phage Avani]|uniref:Uncharacterized protein n=4 Tax=Gracegardnervirinae TaxID=2946632 RepID=A0A385E027_9CAUD|nr:hypothetical protein CL78_gp095 [Mycobacterium phage Avani]YP_009841123.1 hypothetical protein HWB85_gp098 [Mycobacterium phage Renaud18]YP_009957493.1 hypothetical protein I5H41_gp090 [Mycobacterium phage Galactic]YP_009961083.1 hypothetical protein I5H76_gp086 [Mycobacterium phage Phasih]AFL47999.1 hypothetical protein AVANI_95 [Mycobacterium phage Avani]ATN91264.1 hypothetical protein SEA_PHASIH_86 [Mycobacterium phage Phasih]AXQ65004.1 hypothetical protein SEA_RENAUD18_98 [Mycobacteriu